VLDGVSSAPEAVCSPVVDDPRGALLCQCTVGPNSGAFFGVESCDELPNGIARDCSVRAQTDDCPETPSLGEPCPFETSCYFPESTRECIYPGEVLVEGQYTRCMHGVWVFEAYQEYFCEYFSE
jgi:hypothetical protein